MRSCHGPIVARTGGSDCRSNLLLPTFRSLPCRSRCRDLLRPSFRSLRCRRRR
uniref:Uncharacterized protein n=1 Tax=Arundo donax TaxID=35708 RepID=A0A0A8XY52_ARUDO